MPIRCVLLDVEGTTSSIRFVYDQMFPFVRRTVADYLRDHWANEDLKNALQQLIEDIGSEVDWSPNSDNESARAGALDAILKLMDDDVKATGLKQIQGMIWKNGFESGELVSHLYDDVLPAIRRWVAAGIQVRIYSSGSVQGSTSFLWTYAAGGLVGIAVGAL